MGSNADLAVVTVNRQLTTILLAAIALVATLVSPVAAEEPDAAGSEVTVEGGGWGHGIGMSQYGAYGQALEGKTAEEIVGYYYTGSSTAPIVDQVGESHFLITDPTPLWVNLLANKVVFRFEAIGGPLTVCQSGAGGCNYEASPGEVWRLRTVGDGTCQLESDGEPVTEPGDCLATVKGMSPDGSRIEIAGLDVNRDEFARGAVRVRTPNAGNSFHVSLEINLEEYLYGLAEVPFSWHSEALRAQALAGRSYATWRLITRGPEADFSQERRTTCWCHMYATTVDQSYSGWANEAVSGSSKWQAAVNSTANIVITHPAASQANVVAAFYSSSTGGRTENNDDIWGGSPVSYLRSRPDPWSQDPAVNNPFGRWAFGFNEDELAVKFGVDKIDGMQIVARYSSGTPSAVDIYTRTDGVQRTITRSGPELYTLLGLRGRNISGFDYGSIAAVGGDFTGDGRSDVGMFTGFNSTWWVGESILGEFTMDPWLNYTVNNSLRDQVVGDFDGDGKDDLVALQANSGKLLFARSTGGRFGLEAWANHAVANRWGPLLVGDFDGDGVDDLAEYENAGERWRVYRINDGELIREFWYDFSVVNPSWATHVAADYNGDGKDDILSLDANTGGLTVLFSDGAGFMPSTWQSLPGSASWRDVQAADFTGDGKDDLAAYDPATARWWIVPGRAGTTGGAPAAWFTFAYTEQEFVAQVAGDFNNDGKSDIAAYSRITGKLKVLKSNGSAFTKAVWGVVPAKHRVTAVLAIDANGDGKLDIATWDNTLRRWWVARNRAGTNFKVTPWNTLLR